MWFFSVQLAVINLMAIKKTIIIVISLVHVMNAKIRWELHKVCVRLQVYLNTMLRQWDASPHQGRDFFSGGAPYLNVELRTFESNKGPVKAAEDYSIAPDKYTWKMRRKVSDCRFKFHGNRKVRLFDPIWNIQANKRNQAFKWKSTNSEDIWPKDDIS